MNALHLRQSPATEHRPATAHGAPKQHKFAVVGDEMHKPAAVHSNEKEKPAPKQHYVDPIDDWEDRIEEERVALARRINAVQQAIRNEKVLGGLHINDTDSSDAVDRMEEAAQTANVRRLMHESLQARTTRIERCQGEGE